MGPSRLSSVPFWRRINRLRGKQRSNNVANLEENGINYTKDFEKTEILSDRLEKIFVNDNSANLTRTTSTQSITR